MPLKFFNDWIGEIETDNIYDLTVLTPISKIGNKGAMLFSINKGLFLLQIDMEINDVIDLETSPFSWCHPLDDLKFTKLYGHYLVLNPES